MKTKQRLSKIFVAIALAGAASYTLAADTIKIGLAGPVTGAVAQYGDMQFIGAKMAIEQINKNGGVDGQQLEGVVYDDACDPKQAVAVANKIVNDEVKFVVGHLCSSSTQPASDIYEDEGILMITAASTSPDITSRGYELIFRTIGLDSLQGPTAGNFIADHIKPKNVAVIHDKQQYGEGIATAVKETLEKLKGDELERGFVTYRTMCDVRFMDPAVDPNDRKPRWCYLGRPETANTGPVGIGRFSTLRAWLSQWSVDDSNADGPRCARSIGVPLLAIENSADDAVPQPHARIIHDAAGSRDKAFHVIKGATHYYQGQPDLLKQAVELCVGWMAKRNLLD